MKRGPIFDRSVQLGWLDETLRLRRESPVDARVKLDMWMRDRIDSDVGREKTVRLLWRIWLEPHKEVADMIGWAADQSPALADTRPLHLGAMLATHPFFGDACAAIGRQLALEPLVRTSEMTRRLRKRWGDREVVHVGAKSVVRTLRGLGVLAGKPGRTESRPGERIPVPALLSPWLAHALVISRGTAELDGRDLGGSSELFMLDVPSLQPNGYPHGDVFMEGGGRIVFRPHVPPSHPSRQTRQGSLPGMRVG